MKKLFLIIISLLVVNVAAKSKPSLKKADKYFEKLDYTRAKDEYTRLLKGKRTPNYIYLQLAFCYDKLNESVQATKFYAKALEKDPKLESNINYRLAHHLQRNGRYEAAKSEMIQFTVKEPDNAKSTYFIQHLNTSVDDLPDANFYIEESGLNDIKYATHSISLMESDTVLFVSNRTKYENRLFRKLFEVKDKTTQMPNTDVYEAIVHSKIDPTYENVRLLGKINRRFNDGQATMHSSTKVIYFSSESYRHKPFRKNEIVCKRDGAMSLFLAIRKGKKWKKIKVLPFVQPGFTYLDPFVSSDGSYLYYSSNQEGTQGDLDLWRVPIIENGFSFGEPENLGQEINTGFNERSPFVTKDELFYFASDRWGGLGGLDIYVIDLKATDQTAVNLGVGINTPKDDYNFVYNTKRNFGFLTSDRIGRKDIYKVKPNCLTERKITVVDKETKEQLVDVKMEIIDINHNSLYLENSTELGEFEVDLICRKWVKAIFEKEGYYYKEVEDIANLSIDENLEIALKKKPLPVIKEDKVLLNDISFEFNEFTLIEESKKELNQLVQLMNEFPKMRIKIIAHTDNVGREKYNLALSEKRANATAAYLLNNGIAKDRVEAIGVGTSSPKIKCENCTKEQQRINRRSEFIILSQ